MYISAFHIDGFGHFNDVSVSGLPPGMSIFLGQNEAGKSTCLEFLRVMLTGYPELRGNSELKKEERKRLDPLFGGKAGGSLILNYARKGHEYQQAQLVRRPNAEGGLKLATMDGQALSGEVLSGIMSGISREVYRKVFGFSLSELENFNSLAAEGVRNALYGASFGPGLQSPVEVLAIIKKRLEDIFKPGGSKPAINQLLKQLEEVRAKIVEWEDRCARFDGLSLQLAQTRERLSVLRSTAKELESERRRLERRLGVWQQWDQWRNYSMQLEQLGPENESFPENAVPRLARLQEARILCEQQLATRQEKLANLQARYNNLAFNQELVQILPELRRLAENKNSYRQAFNQMANLRDNRSRAEVELHKGLLQLGSDWDCNRIRKVDRSLFAREDMEKQASLMTSAALAFQASQNYLGNANRDMEISQRAYDAAKTALDNIPQPVAELTEQERDELRNNMTRLEEGRRMTPSRERAVNAAKSAFVRALEQTKLFSAEAIREISSQTPLSSRILDEILAAQDKGSTLAQEIQIHLSRAAEINRNIAQAEETAETISRKIEQEKMAQRTAGGATREALDSRSLALRNLRAVSASIAAEEERKIELDTRINSELPPRQIKNWLMLWLGIIFLMASGGITILHWAYGITDLIVSNEITVPVNMWAAYACLFCGVILFCSSFSGGKEKKRYKNEMAKLLARRENSSMHLAELVTQSQQLCAAAEVDDMDPITLDATEMLIERAKEQLFHEERSRREIELLKKELQRAQAKVSELRSHAQQKESQVQQSRRKWHDLMQGLQINTVPSPESAVSVFTRVEAARLAYENVINTQRELTALQDDIKLLEQAITSMPVINRCLQEAQEAISMELAVKQTLDSCHEADLIREQRIRCETVLHNVENELKRAEERQVEAKSQFDENGELLETARSQWRACLDELGLDSQLNPETVRESFKFMDNCLAAEERLLRAETDLANARSQLSSLEEPLNNILSTLKRQVVVTVNNEPDWIATLDNLIFEADSNQAIQQDKIRLEKLIDEESDNVNAEEAACKTAVSREQDLIDQGNAKNAEEFLRAAELNEERKRIRRHVRELEISLSLAASSEPLDKFLESFQHLNREEQEAMLSSIQDKLEETSSAEREAAETAGSLSIKVQTLTNSDDLAELRQQEAMLVEDINCLATDWSVNAIAKGILNKAKNIFERERQPEVIRVASEIFEKITNGRWRGITSSLEKSQLDILPVHGEPVAPATLSRGAQEQAYLALRLAYIRNHAQHAESLPVIMDEILVNFDPDRAERTASAFASLVNEESGKEQQIFYFTCQPYMVDILKSACPEAQLFRVENRTIVPACS